MKIFANFGEIFDNLTPDEKIEVARLLIERVEFSYESIEVCLFNDLRDQ